MSRLTVDYGRGRRRFRAVDDVSLHIGRGETLGLVGESGSGKSTIGRAILGLVKLAEGRIQYGGRDLGAMGRRERRTLGNRLQVIFQDPYSSLDPTKTIGYTLAEPVRLHERASKTEVRRRVHEMLARVGLPDSAAERYPSQFSGGQRQRIAIARALMCRPELVVCDEPVSALDLSIQAEVMNLVAEMQRELRLSVLFISHDLSVVRHVSDRIAVLRRGQVVEEGDANELSRSPKHEYTRELLAAAPVPDPLEQRRRREQRMRAALEA
ncbi:ABC transporter ATP-binding protein [Pseudoclavibacter endophyticus]|nr:ABC transporter ATP-binding protein [Pseudoclavibacter endophyticus]